MSPRPCFARAVAALPCSVSGVSPLTYSANVRYCIILPVARPAGVSRSIAPRTSVIALHNFIPRTAGAHLLLRSTRNYSLTSRKTVAFARMSGGNGAQLQAAFYAACLKRSLPTRCHSEPPRMRRVEESTQAAEKWLQCNNARVPIHKHYCYPARSFDFVPRYSLGT